LELDNLIAQYITLITIKIEDAIYCRLNDALLPNQVFWRRNLTEIKIALSGIINVVFVTMQSIIFVITMLI